LVHASPGKPPGAGKSSFDLIDANKLLAALVLKPHMTVLDLGCGQGNYTLALAEAVGPAGLIYGVDLWEEGLTKLQEAAAIRGFDQVRTIRADVSGPLPLKDASVDVCLLATVLHDLVEAGTQAGALREAARLVKPGGVLAIVEFKKMDGPPGPPRHIRLAPKEVAELLAPYGFGQRRCEEVGPYTYLMILART
jgi:ubiquinone/menaquinone biosynthesis C-methylase UbiE